MAKEDVLAKARDAVADFELWKADPKNRQYFEIGDWMKVVHLLRIRGCEVNAPRDVIRYIDDGTVDNLNCRIPCNDISVMKDNILTGKYDNYMQFKSELLQ